MLLKVPSHPDLKRIVVINPKGGSGKSTLATNVAGFLSSSGHPAALMDFDPQGSTLRWLQNRSDERPEIFGISGCEHDTTMTRSYQMQVPRHIRYLIIDTPAALQAPDLAEFTRGAHAILVPVLPSDIDIHAAARFVSDLLIVAKVSRRMGRLGIVANRVRENTVSYRKLRRFVDRLSIAVIGELRDSQNYVHAADQGLSIHEMLPSRVRKDLASWTTIVAWLEARLDTALTARDILQPKKQTPENLAAANEEADQATGLQLAGGVSFPEAAGISPAAPRTPGYEPPLLDRARDPAE
jgi:chromosome partitioning protein